MSTSQLEDVMEAFRHPFPELTHLCLQFDAETVPIPPDSFLGGSAPRLQELRLTDAVFPQLPRLLLSATQLVDLRVERIPDSGYISPEAIAACLPALSSLKTLVFEFINPCQSRSGLASRHPHLPTRTLLPSLIQLEFRGAHEYLDDLMAFIDAPALKRLEMMFIHPPIDTPHITPHLTQFIDHTPEFKASDKAALILSGWEPHLFDVSLIFPPSIGKSAAEVLVLMSLSKILDSHLRHMVQDGRSTLPQAFIPTVKHLYIAASDENVGWLSHIDPSQWVDLLNSFPAVDNLYLSSRIMPMIAGSLQGLVGETAADVLPALQAVHLEEEQDEEEQDEESLPTPREAVEQFIAARQLVGHAVAISHWEIDEGEEWFTERYR